MTPAPGLTPPASAKGSAAGLAPARSTPSTVDAYALTDCKIAGVRRFAGERFSIPADREKDLCAGGLIFSDRSASELWRAPRGRILAPSGIPNTVKAAPIRGRPIRVLQLTHYDPGASVYRYHSAANTTPGIVSALARFGHSNPHCDLRQYDGHDDFARVRILTMTADVIHCHMDYVCLFTHLRMGVGPTQRVARTYHGSVTPGETRALYEDALDERNRATVFGARPYHLRNRPGTTWLPIPVPVADYAALGASLRSARESSGVVRPFRIAHTPTVRKIKGTEAFLAAVESLRAEGVPIEATLIEGVEHGEALRRKATCDATFDSFFLGIQGSGLEAAAMGQAVVAGDADAAKDLTRMGIPVPYTFAGEPEALRETLRRLATDRAFSAAEAARVGAYVRAHHDYTTVGERYRAALSAAVTPSEPLA